ncbi:hypothetical protein HXX76_005608 [Chlamydomonas incerta]|uniref:Potassium transporter n=1 Tax=Chlamydomonas incerta TaxID=51695 RepID=A0A835T370_CHLIN|nr:hypothetical protein HXX76_005608 [Chlamydomonas incerta]|eukprot:KAG2437994.1 hypothetical protein HXX76_005608 [Chlamydomonas incerta]
MLILATFASVVASQALITGCFSIISNAIKLGAFPKLSVLHTSEHVRGQVYVPEINWTLMLLCIGVVAGFQDTVALGLAYGLTVSSVFVLTTLLILVVMVAVWEVNLALVTPFALVFLIIELAFLSSNMSKVPEGAWFSLAVSAGVCYVMTIWWMGSTRRALLLAASAGRTRLSELFVMMPLQPQQPQQSLQPHAQPGMPQAIAESQEEVEREGDGRALAADTCATAHPHPAALDTSGGPPCPQREIVTASNTPSSAGTHGTATPDGGGGLGHAPSRRRLPAIAAAAGASGRVGDVARIDTQSNSISRDSPARLLAAVSARLSMWRPVQLALRLPPPPPSPGDDGTQGQAREGVGGQLWPLSRQPGIGLYYSETPVGLPHVLIHFLRNVQSVHDVSVFVTVRFVPLPHVQPAERLLVRQLAPFPNFYQVVARYGYMDRVDHGAAFVRQVVTGVVRVLRGGPAIAAEITAAPSAGAGGAGAEGGGAVQRDGGAAGGNAAAAADGIAGGSGSGSSAGGGFRFVTRDRRSGGHRGSRSSANRRGGGRDTAALAAGQEQHGGEQQPQQEQQRGWWGSHGMELSQRGGMVLQPGEVDFVSRGDSSSDEEDEWASEGDNAGDGGEAAAAGAPAAIARDSNTRADPHGTIGGRTAGSVELGEVVVVAAHTEEVVADRTPADRTPADRTPAAPPAALPTPIVAPPSGSLPPGASASQLLASPLPAAPAAPAASRSRPQLARAALGSLSGAGMPAGLPVDEAAVAHVLEAARHGVVYYLGAVRVRPEPSSPLVAQLLFGATYRLLLGLSRSEVEDWRLPYEHVVELGMVLRI